MSATHRVFVYGTLMRGEFHHDVLGRAASYVGEARTHAVFELMWMEYYPALLAGGTQTVTGELYEVDDRTLAALDELEEHPEVYQRLRIGLDGGGEAFAYVLRPEHLEDAEPIASGDFRDLPLHKRRP